MSTDKPEPSVKQLVSNATNYRFKTALPSEYEVDVKAHKYRRVLRDVEGQPLNTRWKHYEKLDVLDVGRPAFITHDIEGLDGIVTAPITEVSIED